MSKEVREIFEKYEKIAKLYRKEDLKQVFLNNANGKEKKIIIDFFERRKEVLGKQIIRANLNILWLIFWFIFQIVTLYLIFFNQSISLKISIPLSLSATTMLFISPFKEKESSQNPTDPDEELMSELYQKMGK
ncbi:MAG: hypothetical protein QNJ60_21340 [Xenococcaceae cyanobacterium MO_188.B19]|nr:hypothetical protein [Xenococcaceae cyanobacterium MO_188.B19]